MADLLMLINGAITAEYQTLPSVELRGAIRTYMLEAMDRTRAWIYEAPTNPEFMLDDPDATPPHGYSWPPKGSFTKE